MHCSRLGLGAAGRGAPQKTREPHRPGKELVSTSNYEGGFSSNKTGNKSERVRLGGREASMVTSLHCFYNNDTLSIVKTQ